MLRSIVPSSKKLLLAIALVASGVQTAQAGFLDAFFGRPAAPVRSYELEPDPLRVTVSKKARKKKVAAQTAPAVVLQMSTLDPAKDPHWYLKDETLRRGDLVVLPDRVLMFRDNASGRGLSAFEDIRRSANLSPRERSRILAMTQIQAGATPKYRIVPEAAVAVTTLNQLDRSTVPVIMP